MAALHIGLSREPTRTLTTWLKKPQTPFFKSLVWSNQKFYTVYQVLKYLLNSILTSLKFEVNFYQSIQISSNVYSNNKIVFVMHKW